ncbi:hypothetical protein MBLNU230_g5866t1 [Neophaeotheca triangularis]
MPAQTNNGRSAPFATFLIVGPTCFFLGIIFALFPYDYPVLWTSPSLLPDAAAGTDPRAPYFDLQESHLKVLHASPPLIARILHIVIGTGILGFLMKLFKPSEANVLFDGASLVLYMCGIVVYVANVVKGLRTITAEAWGAPATGMEGKADPEDGGRYISREDTLRVMSASNTILVVVLCGVLVLQAGQWYAQRKEAQEIAEMDRIRDEKKKAKEEGKSASGMGKKKQ